MEWAYGLCPGTDCLAQGGRAAVQHVSYLYVDVGLYCCGCLARVCPLGGWNAGAGQGRVWVCIDARAQERPVPRVCGILWGSLVVRPGAHSCEG